MSKEQYITTAFYCCLSTSLTQQERVEKINLGDIITIFYIIIIIIIIIITTTTAATLFYLGFTMP